MGRPKQIKNDIGDGNVVDHYKSLRGQDKLEFALQLKVDRSAACITATKIHGGDVAQFSTTLEGWVT